MDAILAIIENCAIQHSRSCEADPQSVWGQSLVGTF
jgi:hypothetical protein